MLFVGADQKEIAGLGAVCPVLKNIVPRPAGYVAQLELGMLVYAKGVGLSLFLLSKSVKRSWRVPSE